MPPALRTWILAARLRTLPAAAAPVLVGTSVAIADDVFDVWRFLCALFGALFIQIGTNLANDYSDARRGADTEDRLGPVRVTAGGLIPPRHVLYGIWVSFGIAVLFGSYLIAVAGWELLVIGVASIIAGVLYTGGPRPYGYAGLGEVFVFLFFGVVAVAGSAFAQLEEWPLVAILASIPVGALASAVLVVNNVRDRETDARVGKRTLAVRLGPERGRDLYSAMLVVAYLALIAIAVAHGTAWPLIALASVPLALRWNATVRNHHDGPTLNGALAGTAQLELIFCVLLSAGILI
ncbi:MAG: 1,4-dihydroxy-2-naphthoate polyprenyltransferase [Solirubrobacteraceae bacterium]|nr:1,4-dihydroxy-2-naphthoate polyprenyltransferase [Solirubrobacteraceae bacterium]